MLYALPSCVIKVEGQARQLVVPGAEHFKPARERLGQIRQPVFADIQISKSGRDFGQACQLVVACVQVAQSGWKIGQARQLIFADVEAAEPSWKVGQTDQLIIAGGKLLNRCRKGGQIGQLVTIDGQAAEPGWELCRQAGQLVSHQLEVPQPAREGGQTSQTVVRGV
ncbi:hypothetical protein ACVWZ4_000824 [Bradyrhizobium sp. USDA 4472]